ncbi:aspartyl-tRNA(Asn)/glutamyl-tRNA(Gln) amidotransferase subunit A [Rhizobium sp. SG_E_25_P2]|uniref:amidase n=1 Tax=Rhizobium sp. SG_E_25_P2 TaxID=2879942 RepID=UPI0024764CC8|nr:amidase [Rhizobium sp. SG_E_25_P2]MDH6267504.1 aspartyl-tRNA(Asn)/glutamyl-tRNA(Gln) amidotransferase subunit A [Rhizobium sp. SG_E_25_P2]
MSLDAPATLAEAARLIRSRQTSSEDLTRAALARARSSQERLNAFIEIEEDAAILAAKMADRALAEELPVGPLHGVPLAHKDMFDRQGFVSGCGSLIRGSYRATQTSTVMRRLAEAGAVSIGRLNMSEFAMGPTGHNAHHGRATNPIDGARVTGGSSSGSGAAVGGGVVLAALGSDTGGSIRLPAACCGVVGIKPTQGRISRHGVMPLSFSQDCVGPLARSVEDAWTMLKVVAGPDGRDPTCIEAKPLEDFTLSPSEIRIGVLGGLFGEDLTSPVAKGMEMAISTLAAAGASVSAASAADLKDVAELANVVAMAEAGAQHFDWMRDRPDEYGPQVRMRLSQSLAIPAPIYLRALQIRSVMLASFLETAFERADVLIAPVMPFAPPLSADVDVGDSPEMNRVVAAMTRFTRPFSYLGLPVVAVPVAETAEGLPISVQCVARPWREDLAAAVAASLEHHLRTDFISRLSRSAA